MAYEALYRRYRPSRFADAFFGQEHVVAALRNAVEGDRVGHAYLFSGPRGTGKTTSARILAKALNCTNLQGGEPCDECDSCLSFQSNSSYDLHELDAASNNGVDAMRDLIGKVALGSPGRTKVYILDEVHMLSSGAENALLKTLEEPPPHVVFVLCTTEPNKVVPTIRSRTQHLEFSLLAADQVGELVDHVVGDAGLEITPEDRSYVIRAGGGSARDTLSALDQVVAAGGAPQGGEFLDALFQALIDRDGAQALDAIDGALHAGRDAASVATALLHELRTVFLAVMRADVSHLPEAEQEQAHARAAAMPPARVTRAVEVLGAAIIEMRQAPDPRVDLEVAIMRLTRPDLDRDAAALLERLEAVEGQLAGGPPIARPTPQSASAIDPAPAGGQPPQDSPSHQVTAQPAAAPQPSENLPSHDAVAQSAPVAHDRPQETVPAQSAPAPTGGRRGADIARAELARQAGSNPAVEAEAAAAAPISAASTPVAQEPSSDQSSEPPGPPGSGAKTLADVRRERQAAAKAAGQVGSDAEVEAAAAARRERQAAAQQTAGAPSAPPVAEPVVEPVAAPSAEPVAEPVVEPVAAPSAPPVIEPVVEPVAAPSAPPVAEPVVEPVAAAQQDAGAPSAPPVAEGAAPPAAAPSSGAVPSLDELNAIWQSMLESMSGRVRSRFSAGHFMQSTAQSAQFGLPNPVHRDRCEEIRSEVDSALATHFGRPIPLELVVDDTEPEPDFFAETPRGGSGVAEPADDRVYEDEVVDVHDLVDATGDVPSAEDRVLATFEGSTVIEDPPTPPLDR